jgi:hypothetical protein
MDAPFLLKLTAQAPDIPIGSGLFAFELAIFDLNQKNKRIIED